MAYLLVNWNTWNSNGVAIKLVIWVGIPKNHNRHKIIQKQQPDEMCYLWKKMFLEISQNSQGNTCTRLSFLIKLQAGAFIKKETLAQGVFLWILQNF